jgi:hypothetical protein
VEKQPVSETLCFFNSSKYRYPPNMLSETTNCFVWFTEWTAFLHSINCMIFITTKPCESLASPDGGSEETIFWGVTPCSLVDGYRRFEATPYHQIHGLRVRRAEQAADPAAYSSPQRRRQKFLPKLVNICKTSYVYVFHGQDVFYGMQEPNF